MTERPVIAITGANGYLGSVCGAAFVAAGFSVRRLVRNPDHAKGDRKFSLAQGCDADALAGVSVLIHCAYDFTPRSRHGIWATNVLGTRRLLKAAQDAAVPRTILISSMSAYAGTRQHYGRAKLASELDARAVDAIIVRPGLVYGPQWGGTAGSLRTLASLPIVPLVAPHAHQFTIREDEFTSAMVTLATAPFVPRVPLGLAEPTPIEFRELLIGISRATTMRTPRFGPIPWRALYRVMRVGELLRLPLPLRADSLLGLVRPAKEVPGIDEVTTLSIRFSPFDLGNE
jgi:nucleoside-diphosphate-sugar epimerase